MQLLQSYLQEDYRGTRDSLKVHSFIYVLFTPHLSLITVVFSCKWSHVNPSSDWEMAL